MFLGADPTGARALAGELLARSRHTVDLIDRLRMAEVASQVVSGAVGLVDEVHLGLRAVAVSLETAAHEVGTFRLDLDSRSVDVITPVPPDRLFARAVDALRSGLLPDDAGLDSHHLPDGYEEWFEAHAAVVEAHNALSMAQVGAPPHEWTTGSLAAELDAALERRAATSLDQRMVELGADPDAVDRSLTPTMAALLVGGADGAAAAGRYLASRGAEVDLGQVVTLAGDPDFALSWLNALGVDGVVSTTHSWASRSPAQFQVAMPALALALATASRSGKLAFDGNQLVQADFVHLSDPIASPDSLPHGSFHIELLLLDPTFDAAFVRDAVTASFERGAIEQQLASRPAHAIDRRLTAVAALVANDASVSYARSAPDETLGQVLGSAYGRPHPLLEAPGHVDAPVWFAASLGADVEVAHRAMHGVDSMGSIADPRLARGIDLMLATTASSFVLAPADASAFHRVHRSVLARGSGVATLLAANTTVPETFTHDGLMRTDLESFGAQAHTLGRFLARVRADAFAAGPGRSLRPGVVDLADMASVSTGVVGVSADAAGNVTVGAVASVAGLLLALAGLRSSRSTPSERALAALATSLFETDNAYDNAVRRGAIRTGRVVDRTGRGVTLSALDTFETDDDDAWFIDDRHLGDWVAGRTRDVEDHFDGEAEEITETVDRSPVQDPAAEPR